MEAVSEQKMGVLCCRPRENNPWGFGEIEVLVINGERTDIIFSSLEGQLWATYKWDNGGKKYVLLFCCCEEIP